jgi:hypothetical protein
VRNEELKEAYIIKGKYLLKREGVLKKNKNKNKS